MDKIKIKLYGRNTLKQTFSLAWCWEFVYPVGIPHFRQASLSNIFFYILKFKNGLKAVKGFFLYISVLLYPFRHIQINKKNVNQASFDHVKVGPTPIFALYNLWRQIHMFLDILEFRIEDKKEYLEKLCW